jgi:hypothetical protein
LTAEKKSFNDGATMAKPTKKPAGKPAASKSAAKSNKTTKASAAAGKSAAKQEAKPKQSLAKTLVKAAAKVFANKDDAKASKAKSKETVKPAVKTTAKAAAKPVAPATPAVSAKAPKASKAPKKKVKKEGFEEDDELLVQDDDMGSEEIPDLSEFEAEETAEEEVSLDAADDALEAAEAAAPTADDEVYLTDAEGRRYCRVRDCDQVSVVEGYCRFHYLQLWKRIQVRRKILTDGKLERYVEELTSRYPDKFLEMIRKDLKSEKDFLTVIAELEIDESVGENELEDEAQSYIDEVRGLSSESGMTDSEEEF